MTPALPRLTENTSRHPCLDSRTFGYALSSDAFQALLGASQRAERSSDGCPFFLALPIALSFLSATVAQIHHLQCLSPSDLRKVPDPSKHCPQPDPIDREHSPPACMNSVPDPVTTLSPQTHSFVDVDVLRDRGRLVGFVEFSGCGGHSQRSNDQQAGVGVFSNLTNVSHSGPAAESKLMGFGFQIQSLSTLSILVSYLANGLAVVNVHIDVCIGDVYIEWMDEHTELELEEDRKRGEYP